MEKVEKTKWKKKCSILFPSIFQKSEESRTAGRTTFVHCNLKEKERQKEREMAECTGSILSDCDWGSNASQLDLIGTNDYSPSPLEVRRWKEGMFPTMFFLLLG